MSFSVGELLVALTAGTDGFNRGLDIATQQLRDFANNAEKQTSALGSTFKTLAIGIGALAGGGAALFAAVNAAAQSVGAIHDQVATLGLDAEQFQRLTFAAKDFDVSAGELAQTIRIFNRNVGQTFNAGTQAQSVFKTLGISVTDVGGKIKPTQSLIFEFADALATKVPNAQQRASFAMEAFGRSGANLVPLLGAGSKAIQALGDEAQLLGFVLSNETVKNADIAAEAFDRLTGVFSIQLKGALVELAPLLLDLAAAVLPDMAVAARVLVGVFTGLRVALAAVQVVVVGAVSAFGRLLTLLLDLVELSGKGLSSVALLLTGDIKGAVQASKEATSGFVTSIREELAGLKNDVQPAVDVVGDLTREAGAADAALAKLGSRATALSRVAAQAAAAIRAGAESADKARNAAQNDGAPLQTTSTEGAALLKKTQEDRAAAAADAQGELVAQAVAIERQVKLLREAKLSDDDRAIANLEILRLNQQQNALLARGVTAQAQLPELFAAVNDQIGRLAKLDPQAAAQFANELGARLAEAAKRGPEAQAQELAKAAQEIGARVEAEGPHIGAAVGTAVSDGLQTAFRGDNGLQAFGASLQAIGQQSLDTAFKDAATGLGPLLEHVFGKAAGTFGGVLTGVFGAVLGAAFNKTKVTSAAGNIQSAVENAQQVRGVISGPTSLGVAKVGESIRDAFRESERLLGIIARNTTTLASGRRSAAESGFAAVSESALALSSESASLV